MLVDTRKKKVDEKCNYCDPDSNARLQHAKLAPQQDGPFHTVVKIDNFGTVPSWVNVIRHGVQDSYVIFRE